MSLPPEIHEGVPVVTRTAHAMLVPWGRFAHHIGLVQALAQVPVPQRAREHTPQTKLLEFLVAILSGCAYLQDISHGPQPLDRDQTVAHAWGQLAWADYSGVSRTLHTCTPATVVAVRAAMAQVTRSFIDREVVLALRQRGRLVYDGDLTGRAVSNTSTTYEGAAFGWMGDAVALGYQAALVSLHSPTYGRLWLSVAPHPGDTVSCSQAEALVRAAEGRTGVRPLRRLDLLSGRIGQQRAALQQTHQRRRDRQTRQQQAQQRFHDVAAAWRHAVAEVGQLVERAAPGGPPAGPYSRLTKARQKVATYWQRLRRRGRDLAQVRRAVTQQEHRVQELQAALTTLEDRYARLAVENRRNRAPVQAIFRLDGGFGSGENLALLIELGYEVYGKAISDRVTQAVRHRVGAETQWLRVGANAEMVVWPSLALDCCPYPLDVGLERFYTGQQERYATLLHYGQDAVTEDVPGWFAFYNARQTIEAGVKEGKHVFQMHHLKVRSAAGLAIQEEFAILAANLVRWAARWLHEQCPQAPAPFNQPQASVKKMVRVAANTTALVFWQPGGHLLVKFDELSPFEGVELRIGCDGAFQPPLPLYSRDDFEPI